MSVHRAASHPLDGAPAPRRRVLLALGVLSGLTVLGTALSPYLLTEHPLVLLGLNPGGRHLVLVATGWTPPTRSSSRRFDAVSGSSASTRSPGLR